jgi:hypothetical protein
VLVSEQSIVPRAGRVYTVYPSDPNNPVELSETKSFLQSVAGQELHNDWNGETFISWTVSLKEDGSIEDLTSHPGIRRFELQDTSSDLQQIYARQEEEPKNWIAYVEDPSNVKEVKKTREWLDSKVQDKSLIEEILSVPKGGEDWNNRLLTAWAGLTLNDAGVEEAKQQPGIKEVKENHKMASLSNVKSRDEGDPDTWIAWAKDPNNWEAVKKTRVWLDSNVKGKNEISEILTVPNRGESWDNRRVLGWARLILDDAGVEQAKKQPGIMEVEVNHRLVGLNAITPSKRHLTG